MQEFEQRAERNIIHFTRLNGFPGYTKKQCQEMLRKIDENFIGPFRAMGVMTDTVELKSVDTPLGEAFEELLGLTKGLLEQYKVTRVDIICLDNHGRMLACNSNNLLKAHGELEETADDFSQPWR